MAENIIHNINEELKRPLRIPTPSNRNASRLVKFSTFGLFGLLSGYCIKKIGKYVLIFIGGGIVIFEVMGYKNYADEMRERMHNANTGIKQKTKSIIKALARYHKEHMMEYGGFICGLLGSIFL